MKSDEDRVKIGPQIPRSLKRQLDFYSINTGIDREIIVEMALSQFLQDKDLTPVVQLQLFEAVDITYSDPRFEVLKDLIEMSHTTKANKFGKQKLLKRLQSTYAEACRVGTCPELKLEYEEAMKMLTE